MSYEVIWINGSWDVFENGIRVDAYIRNITIDEGYTDGQNGRTYYPISGSARAQIRLPNGRLVNNVPVR